MVDERRDVVGHESYVDRPIDVGCAAVPLEVGDDDLMACRQRIEHRPERLARGEPTVQQHYRTPGAVDLVVEVEAVDLGVHAGAGRLCRPVGGHRGAPCVIGRADYYRSDRYSRKFIEVSQRLATRTRLLTARRSSIATYPSRRCSRSVSKSNTRPGLIRPSRTSGSSSGM